ncbi:MAG TPA: HDOD domain-containing protein [Solirubrobacterales bacterium]|jgi:putative nucleotidyltransferase with HDIG domain
MASTTTQTSGRPSAAADIASKANRGAPAPGSRLAEAFEAVERFPVLIESRERVITAATAETARVGELVEAVEADVALAISVLRFANRGGMTAGGVAGVPDAVDVLKPSGVLAIAGTAPSFDFFESNGGWELKPERFRVHALATQRAADQIGRAVGWVERDELATAALLHDVGRLVISRLHPGYKVYFDAATRTPEHRLRDEREQLGIDHALVGGVLARRWNLPQRLAVAIERHHAEDAEGLAAMVSTADMVAHYTNGEAIAPERLMASCERIGLGPEALRDLLYELPLSTAEAGRISEPCPLSARELDVLRHLSEGMVYKQIATEMHLSVSTIRTHLHNVYGKIGAVDRAQAVLTARDRGWI